MIQSLGQVDPDRKSDFSSINRRRWPYLQHTNSLKQGEKCVDPRKTSQGFKRHQEDNLLGFYLSLSSLGSEVIILYHYSVASVRH